MVNGEESISYSRVGMDKIDTHMPVRWPYYPSAQRKQLSGPALLTIMLSYSSQPLLESRRTPVNVIGLAGCF